MTLLSDMHDRKNISDVNTHTALIDSLCKQGEINTTISLFELMGRKRHKAYYHHIHFSH